MLSRRHVLAGAAQAFDTRLPAVTWDRPLAAALAALPASSVRLALDNYEASTSFGKCNPIGYTASENVPPVVLAFGPERGWGREDRQLLRAHGFALVQLGPRPLRTETAVVAAVALLKAQPGLG